MNECYLTLTRSLRRRSGEAQAEVRRLTEQIAAQARMALGQAKKLLEEAMIACARVGRASGRAATSAINRSRDLVARSSKVVEQVRRRFAGEKIANRLVSLHDPDARPPLTG